MQKRPSKIVRTANRYIKYSDAETTEPDILIFVCENINALEMNLKKTTVLYNLYNSLLKRITKAVNAMHEDMQYDYLKVIERLTL
ncbi:MAG: hypothetical protein WKF88_04550 [Ferruginibacter sp.]